MPSFMPSRTNGEPHCRQCWENIEVGAACPHPVNGDCPGHGVWPVGQWAGASLNQLSKNRVHFRLHFSHIGESLLAALAHNGANSEMLSLL